MESIEEEKLFKAHGIIWIVFGLLVILVSFFGSFYPEPVGTSSDVGAILGLASIGIGVILFVRGYVYD